MKTISHWYDGWLYHYFVTPFQMRIYKPIIQSIPKGSTVLDVATGTGDMLRIAGRRFRNAVGIDLSPKNITRAKGLIKRNLPIKFTLLDALDLESSFNAKFDYSILSFALHEMPHEIRTDVLEQMKKVSKNIILADYKIPMKNNLSAKLIHLVEYSAGKKHYEGFKSFIQYGGLDYYLNKIGISEYETIAEKYSGNSVIIKIKLED